MKKKKIGIYIIVFVGLLLLVGIERKNLEEKNRIKDSVLDEFSYIADLYDIIYQDLKCFPVVKEEEGYPVAYENSWGERRSYGGERMHEGCDLMALNSVRGKYKICSMTDGVVEKIGWLEQGGWRIGIRSPEGIYYYYAHLDSYEKAFKKGEQVVAGQILGRMGDSGYGREPDTKGKFDVHLHVGIYVKDLNGMERALNPYWFLKQLEN